ncbi:MAG: hypothetical protein Q9170_002197 [Blastenia crenularia]
MATDAESSSRRPSTRATLRAIENSAGEQGSTSPSPSPTARKPSTSNPSAKPILVRSNLSKACGVLQNNGEPCVNSVKSDIGTCGIQAHYDRRKAALEAAHTREGREGTEEEVGESREANEEEVGESRGGDGEELESSERLLMDGPCLAVASNGGTCKFDRSSGFVTCPRANHRDQDSAIRSNLTASGAEVHPPTFPPPSLASLSRSDQQERTQRNPVLQYPGRISAEGQDVPMADSSDRPRVGSPSSKDILTTAAALKRHSSKTSIDSRKLLEHIYCLTNTVASHIPSIEKVLRLPDSNDLHGVIKQYNCHREHNNTLSRNVRILQEWTRKHDDMEIISKPCRQKPPTRKEMDEFKSSLAQKISNLQYNPKRMDEQSELIHPNAPAKEDFEGFLSVYDDKIRKLQLDFKALEDVAKANSSFTAPSQDINGNRIGLAQLKAEIIDHMKLPRFLKRLQKLEESVKKLQERPITPVPAINRTATIDSAACAADLQRLKVMLDFQERRINQLMEQQGQDGAGVHEQTEGIEQPVPSSHVAAEATWERFGVKEEESGPSSLKSQQEQQVGLV